MLYPQPERRAMPVRDRRLVSAASLLALLFVCVLARTASAQAPATPPPPPPFREGSADFSLLVQSGNTSSEALGLNGDIIYRPKPWVIENKAAYVRTKSDGIVDGESFRYQFRADRNISERVSFFGRYDFLHDEFSGVGHRNEITGGVDYLTVNKASQTLHLFAGIGYTNEGRVGVPTPDPDSISTAMLDLGWKYKWKLSSTADFTDDFRYDAGFDRSENWRIGHLAALSAKVTNLLSLKVSTGLAFVNFPPTGRKKTDATSSVALVAKF
jgi:putative salt-induced outer membrane protein